MERTPLGFVGLGAMGGAIAGRLLAAGHELHGTNRTRSKAEPLIERGLIWHDTPREVAAAAGVVFSMVSDDAALAGIATGPDGILAGLGPGKVHLDMSTVSPAASVELAARVRALGARMLDAPVSGSVPQAEAGTLTIMVGGDEAAVRQVAPLLDELGHSVTRIGENGKGLLLKLAININLAAQTLAFSEGLLLAERGGIDPQLAARVMSDSAIGSPGVKARVPMLLDLPEHGWFDVSMLRKDIRLALDAGRDEHVPLPSAATAQDMLTKAGELGYDGRDIAALHEVLGGSPVPQRARKRVSMPRPRVREHAWSPPERAVLIAVIAIVMGSLFLTTYTLALGDPVPRHIDAALVGDPARHARTIDAVQQVADGSLAFRRYGSVAAAREAIDLQRVYTALDVRSARPTLFVASAAGASVARVLEKVTASDPRVRVVDIHPLDPSDPNGVDIFYLMLVATIVGFITVFQVRANAGGLPLRHWTAFVAAFALVAALVLALVAGPVLGRLPVPVAKTWGLLTLHVLAVASFASIMTVWIGRWAILPTWLFFVVLGNSASGGAVSPPLLPPPFAFVSQWLPSGATVTSLRDAIYFRGYEHVRPIVVLMAWSAGMFVAMLALSQHRRASPGGG